MAVDVTANFHGGDTLSKQAHSSTKESSRDAVRRKILDTLRRRGGMTCEELELTLDVKHQSCSARVAELRRDGLITEDGFRFTSTNRKARVHKVA